MKHIYIIAGANGAGKTTASYTILPEIFNCDEFVNADEIARGLSPFKPERVAIQAGRLMLENIRLLINTGKDFAFETTLAAKIFRDIITDAKRNSYFVSLLFFWLNSPELAIQRVKTRVMEGGHSIPEDVIIRRYNNGISNFFKIYKSIVDSWIFIDNSFYPSKIIARSENKKDYIYDDSIWNELFIKYRG